MRKHIRHIRSIVATYNHRLPFTGAVGSSNYTRLRAYKVRRNRIIGRQQIDIMLAVTKAQEPPVR